MDKKLAEYRKRKEREIYIQQLKLKMSSYFQSIFNLDRRKEPVISETAEEQDEQLIETESDTDIPFEDVEDDVEQKKCTVLDYVYYSLWFSLWLILYIIFIQIGFGLVYLLLSGFVGMYLNTRTAPKKRNEASAYSVFNKNCESIDGTLKAEHLERQLLYGPSVVR